MVESIATHSEALETQISLLAQTPVGPFPEKHADVVITTSKKSIENPKESDNEEGSGVKRVKIEKDPLTPPEREVVEEVEKEALCVVPHPYKSLIPFPRRSVEVKVHSKSEGYKDLLENIHTNAHVFEDPESKRKTNDKLEQPMPKKEPRSSPPYLRYKPLYNGKKRKSEGYERRLDKCPWKTNDVTNLQVR